MGASGTRSPEQKAARRADREHENAWARQRYAENPVRRSSSNMKRKQCPSCGGDMDRQSRVCRECYVAEKLTATEDALRCAHCERWLPDDAFNCTRSATIPRRGRHIYCRDCTRKRYDSDCHRQLRERVLADPDRKAAHAAGVENARLRRRYGITSDEYEVMLEVQGGSCAVCGATANPDGSKLAVDHDHATDEIRGLLCRLCNWTVGMLGDNAQDARMRTEAICHYLEQAEGE